MPDEPQLDITAARDKLQESLRQQGISGVQGIGIEADDEGNRQLSVSLTPDVSQSDLPQSIGGHRIVYRKTVPFRSFGA